LLLELIGGRRPPLSLNSSSCWPMQPDGASRSTW